MHSSPKLCISASMGVFHEQGPYRTHLRCFSTCSHMCPCLMQALWW